jgi:hypothetical protein
MIRAVTTPAIVLPAAEVSSETVDVRYRGAVDFATYECRDIPRSTLIQRACYGLKSITLHLPWR